MPFAKSGSGQIGNYCLPNALLTFKEYLLDYADPELRQLGEQMILCEIDKIPNPKQRDHTRVYLRRINDGERDLRF